MAVATRQPAADTVQIKARQRGIGVYSLKSGASFDFDPTARDEILIFGYSSIKEAHIIEARAQAAPTPSRGEWNCCGRTTVIGT